MRFEELVRMPVYEQVADRIKEAILRGEFLPGLPLPAERELSESFGVSRTSIREALRSLMAQGLLVANGPPPSRAVVADVAGGPLREVMMNLLQLEQVGLKDLVDFRYVLESAAVERAARRRDPEALREAREALSDMRRIDADLERFDAADVRFHLALARASGNDVMHKVMVAVREAMTRYLFEALRAIRERPGGLGVLVGEHEAVLEAVERGDEVGASELIRDHIVDFYDASLEARTATGDLPQGGDLPQDGAAGNG